MGACDAAAATNAAAAAALLSRRSEPSAHRRFTISCHALPRNLSAQQKKQRGTNIALKQLSPNTMLLLPAEDNGQFPNTSSTMRTQPPQQSASSDDGNSGAIGQSDETVAANGNEQQESEFECVASRFQENNNIRLILKYDEALSHCIYAASDMFIVSSVFEPCGLTQNSGTALHLLGLTSRILAVHWKEHSSTTLESQWSGNS